MSIMGAPTSVTAYLSVISKGAAAVALAIVLRFVFPLMKEDWTLAVALLSVASITVANLIFNGKLDRSSNFGPASVDIAAPGTFILSTIPDKSYAFMSGTSMAAPMVAGAAAMLYSARPELSLQDVRNILITSAHKLDTLNGRVYSGGMLDVYSALQWARQ